MRVLMIGPFGLHPNKTMQSRALSLAKALVERGHVVKIIMPPWQTAVEANKSWHDGGVEMRYVSLKGGMLFTVWRMFREAMAWQPDVIHSFKPKAYSGLVAWLLWQFKRHNLRLVTDTDDWEGWGGWNDLAPYSTIQKHFFAWQERWGMAHCHALTVASRELEKMALAHAIPREQVHYLPNGAGIALEEGHGNAGHGNAMPLQDDDGRGMVSPCPNKHTLLLYSRLFEFDTARLVAVLAGVKAIIPDVDILAIGTGLFDEQNGRFHQQLTAAGLNGNIRDVGWVEVEQLPALLAQADVGLYLMDESLLNRTKCPVKLADMIAVGLPVVGEDVGQVGAYVRDGVTGLLCESGDVEGVKTAVVSLLQNRSQRQQFGEAARAHYQAHFAWSLLAAQLETVYGR